MAAQIPVYSRQVDPNTPLRLPRAEAPSDQGLQAVVGVLDHIRQQDALAHANEALATLRLQGEQMFLKAQETAGPAAENFTPTVLKQFKDATDQAVKKAGPLSGRMIQQGALEFSQNLGSRAVEFEAGARRTNRTASVVNSIATTAAAVELNPDSWTQATAQQRATIDALGVPPQQREALMVHMDETLAAAAGRGYIVKDPEGSLKRLSDAKDPLFSRLDTQARTALTAFAKNEFATDVAKDVIGVYGQSVFKGDKALDFASKSDRLPDDVRDDMRRKVAQGIDLLRDERQRTYSQPIAALHARIATDAVHDNDEAVALGLYAKGALTPEGYASLLSGIGASRLQHAAAAIPLAEAANAFNNSIALNPTDEKAKKAVGQVFTAQTKNVAPGSDAYINTLVEWSRRTNIVPEPALAWARATITNAGSETQGSADQAALAADMLQRVQERAPQAYSFVEDPKTRAFATQMNTAMAGGATSLEAVKVARRNVFEMTPQQQDTLKAGYTALKVNTVGELQSRLNSDNRFDQNINPFRGAPDVPPDMAAAYDAAVRQYYTYTGGNLDQAEAIAYRDVTRRWGYTTVNGAPQLLKDAPETRWPVATPSVRKDIDKTVTPLLPQLRAINPQTGDYGPVDVKAKDVKLVPSDLTERSHGLSWWLGIQNEYGDLDYLRDKSGRPVDYRLPVAPTELAAEAKAKADEAIAKARKLNADRRQANEFLREQAEAGDEDAMNLLSALPAANEQVAP